MINDKTILFIKVIGWKWLSGSKPIWWGEWRDLVKKLDFADSAFELLVRKHNGLMKRNEKDILI